MNFASELDAGRREYEVVRSPHAAEFPWVCAAEGCQWGRPAAEPRPLKCGRCGSKVIKAGRHGRAVEVEADR